MPNQHTHFTTNYQPSSTHNAKPSQVMVAEAMDISRETYIAIVMDRESGGPMVVCSPCGGVDIEEVAHNQPHKIFKVGKGGGFGDIFIDN